MKRLFRAVPFLLVLASVACFSVFGCVGCAGTGGGDDEGPTVEEEAGEPLPGDDASGAEEDM